MRERYFDFRITGNGKRQLTNKMLVPVLLSFVLLFSPILPVSIAEANGSLMIEAGALCERALPDTVTAGEEFEVIVTFAAPADRFHAIGLIDVAPAGWDVSVDVAWTEPQAMVAHTPEPEMAAYIWAGPYAAGIEFTAVYKIEVPVDAEPGTYTFTGSVKYYIEPHPAPSYEEAITGAFQAHVVDAPAAARARILGVTREVDGTTLSGVTVSLYRNGVEIANVVGDGDGNYELELPELGDYDLVASKEGFRGETQPISVTEPATYNLDFAGDYGFIPDAPSKSYVLACMNLWKSEEQSFQLSTSRLLELLSAWKYP